MIKNVLKLNGSDFECQSHTRQNGLVFKWFGPLSTTCLVFEFFCYSDFPYKVEMPNCQFLCDTTMLCSFKITLDKNTVTNRMVILWTLFLSGFQIAAAILFLSFKNWTHLAGF
jgi:hypothetical protein